MKMKKVALMIGAVTFFVTAVAIAQEAVAPGSSVAPSEAPQLSLVMKIVLGAVGGLGYALAACANKLQKTPSEGFNYKKLGPEILYGAIAGGIVAWKGGDLDAQSIAAAGAAAAPIIDVVIKLAGRVFGGQVAEFLGKVTNPVNPTK